MKGLKLDTTTPMGVGIERRTSIEEHWSTFDAMEQSIVTLGLGDLRQPQGICPMLTEQIINEPNSANYSDNQQHFISWLNFATELLARVDAQILQYENMLAVLAAETKSSYRQIQAGAEGAKKLTVDELNTKLLLSPEYKKIKHTMQQLQQKRYLLKARVDTLDSDVRLLSRRIELTKMDREATNAANNTSSRFTRR